MTPARDPLILGLTGRAGSGKDTAAQYLCQRYGFVSIAFADPLRDMTAVLLEAFGIDYAVMTERALKERPIPELGGHSARRLLQLLGTEWGRQLVHAEIWIRALEHRAGLASASPIHDRIVVTDCRFANEADRLRRHGGVIVRIVRDDALDLGAAMLAPEAAGHRSEAGVPVSHISHVIDNSGTLGQLHTTLDGLCRTLGIEERGEGPELR